MYDQFHELCIILMMILKDVIINVKYFYDIKIDTKHSLCIYNNIIEIKSWERDASEYTTRLSGDLTANAALHLFDTITYIRFTYITCFAPLSMPQILENDTHLEAHYVFIQGPVETSCWCVLIFHLWLFNITQSDCVSSPNWIEYSFRKSNSLWERSAWMALEVIWFIAQVYESSCLR